ncbi:VWA domain-containing protein [Shewanella atlantica]|uniref:VWA domain-containing protein n=1 Tax=Shewanella atlantica TaxID=271099 RepID=UPI003736A2F5
MIHFLRPEWFLALLPLLLLIWLLWQTEQANSSWSRYISAHLAELLVAKTKAAKRPSLRYLAISWVIAVFALAGPAFTKQSLPVFEAAQGRVIVMDMSLSMFATDQAPNRLAQAKFKATDLIGELTEGETGLVAYAGDAYTISPLTRDRATLLNLLPTLSPDIMPSRGSNLVNALEQSKNLLAQGGHIRGDIVLLADGVSPRQVKDAKKILKGTQYRLGILALGSEQGSPIRLPDGQLLRDNADQVVVAKTNYAELNELAMGNDGILVPYRADGEDLQRLLTWLSSTGETKATELDGEIWQDAGPFIALLLLFPVLLSFRHGLACFALVCLVYQPAPVSASAWDDAWQTRDQQGMQAYQAQDYQAASEKFSDPQWQASALYKAGSYDDALSLFEQDNSAAGLYNQGNTLMQQGKYDEAIERYENAIKKDPGLSDAEDNLELAKKLAEQKQESSEQNNDSGQGDNSERDKNSDDEKQSEQEQGSDKSEGSENSDNSQQQKGDESEQEQNSASGDDSEQSNGAQDEQETKQNPNPESSQQDPASSSQENSNDAEMQADPNKQQPDVPQLDQSQQASAEDKENVEPQPAEAAQPQEADGDTQAPSSAQGAAQQVQTPDQLPPEMERALRALADDPQVLLRNKMQLEYQKRRRQGIAAQEQEQW